MAHRPGEETFARKLSQGPTRSGQLIPSRKIRPWAESLSYAITDRRLLILEGDVVTDSYTPDLLRLTPKLLIRGSDHGDVVFDRVSDESSFPHAPDRDRIPMSFDQAVGAERRAKAFKGLVDAESIRQRVEDWIRGHKERVEKALRDFVGRRSPDDEEVCQRVANASLGLTIVLPVGMDLRVRTRSLPAGKTGIDREIWRELSGSDDWNTLEARATVDFYFEIALQDTPQPSMTLKSMKGGFFTRLFAGKILAVEESLQIGTFRGFSVTRATLVDSSVLRQVLLHDGRRQLFVQGRWPQGSEIQEQTMDTIVKSLEWTRTSAFPKGS